VFENNGIDILYLFSFHLENMNWCGWTWSQAKYAIGYVILVEYSC